MISRLCTLTFIVCLATPALAARMDEAQTAYDEGKLEKAEQLLAAEVTENPGHIAAKVLLGKTLEALKKWDEAEDVWQKVMKAALNEPVRDEARRALIRIRRHDLESKDLAELAKLDQEAEKTRKDAFHFDVPPIPWEDIEAVEDKTYEDRTPKFHYESKHFDVFATNEKLAKVIAELSEIYLQFMTDRLFGGRAWGFRLPIFCYATEEDYISVGGAPGGSHGVTSGSISGKSRYVMLFHRLKIEEQGGSEREVMYKYAVESILFHELTHVMINEFFGGQDIPQWLHEAVAGRLEQTRDHYLEAARLARAVVAGEHFRVRDLFEQEGYPSSRIGLFYEQSAIIVLYLFEAGSEAMYTFFNELAQQKTHDQALSAALGIPEEGAVEAFEKMWVDWMKRRYVLDLKPDVGETTEEVAADVLTAVNLQPPVDEVAGADSITEWRSMASDTLSKDFCGVGETLEDWSAANGVLKSVVHDNPDVGSYLGVKIYEKRPMVLKCTFRMDGANESQAWAGFAMLDAANEDTGIQVLAPMTDGTDHTMLAVVTDELAVYVDGVCTGRRPVPVLGRRDASADYPLAFVSYGPLQVSNIQVGHIENLKSFDPKPPEATSDQPQGDQQPSSSGRGRGRGRR